MSVERRPQIRMRCLLAVHPVRLLLSWYIRQGCGGGGPALHDVCLTPRPLVSGGTLRDLLCPWNLHLVALVCEVA